MSNIASEEVVLKQFKSNAMISQVERYSSLSNFTMSMLKKRHLLSIAQKIIAQEALLKAEVLFLANETDIPGLLKLIQIGREVNHWQQQVRFRPTFYLPIASVIEEEGLAAAKQISLQRLQKLLEDDLQERPLDEELYVIVDSWLAGTTIEPVLDVIAGLPTAAWGGKTIIYLGPSSREVIDLIEPSGPPEHEQIAEILALLKQAGIFTLHGGADVRVHEIGIEQGFTVSVGQEIVREIGQGVAIKQISFNDHFIDQLIWLQHRLQPNSNFKIWFPWTSGVLDSGKPTIKLPLGAQIFRAIAIARLVLPNVKWIRAPLSMMGTDNSHLAVAFGANDLGFVALDAMTATELGLKKLSQLKHAIDIHDIDKIFGGSL